MATNPNDSAARKRIGRFARALLATTCLTVVSGSAALAGTCTFPEGGSLEGENSPPTALTATANPGSTSVCGYNVEDGTSFWELTGLGVGTYTVFATTLGEGTPNAADLYISTSPTFSSFIVDGAYFDKGVNALSVPAATIPGSGDLYFAVGPNSEDDSNNWSVTVTTTGPSTPEPSTVATMGLGLGLAGALTLGRRKRRKQ